MIELYPNISEELREQAKVMFNLIHDANPETAAHMLHDFTNRSGRTEEEKDFLEFYFKLRLEMMNNDNNSVVR